MLANGSHSLDNLTGSEGLLVKLEILGTDEVLDGGHHVRSGHALDGLDAVVLSDLEFLDVEHHSESSSASECGGDLVVDDALEGISDGSLGALVPSSASGGTESPTVTGSVVDLIALSSADNGGNLDVVEAAGSDSRRDSHGSVSLTESQFPKTSEGLEANVN